MNEYDNASNRAATIIERVLSFFRKLVGLNLVGSLSHLQALLELAFHGSSERPGDPIERGTGERAEPIDSIDGDLLRANRCARRLLRLRPNRVPSAENALSSAADDAPVALTAR